MSFLSRIIGGRKKDQLSASEDDASEPDVNPHMDPDALSQPIGFIPRFPRPPKYIKVRAHFKKEKTFNRVFVAQELNGTDVSPSPSNNDGSASSYTEVPGGQGTGKAVWALGFSKDGKYLAAAGQDRKVRVWAVISSPSDRDGPDAAAAEADEGQQDDQDPPRLKAPVFRSEPVQVYEGHTGSILDLSWSKVRATLYQVQSRRSWISLRKKMFLYIDYIYKKTDPVCNPARITFSFLHQWTKRSGCGM